MLNKKEGNYLCDALKYVNLEREKEKERQLNEDEPQLF